MDAVNIDIEEEPVVPEENTSTTSNELPSSPNSCLSSVAIFFFGMMLAVPGGGLLGRTAVVVHQSLETLAEDKKLMDHLENNLNSIRDYAIYISEKINLAHRTHNAHMFNVFISALAVEFGGLTGIFSLVAGLTVGKSMYKLVIQNSNESAEGKALSVAGPLCLMVISTVGCFLGLLLHPYLSITFTAILCFLFFLVLLGLCAICFKNYSRRSSFLSMLIIWIFSPLNTPVTVCYTLLMTFLFQSKLHLLVIFIFKIFMINASAEKYGFNLDEEPLTLSLMIIDVFNVAKQPIITLQQANITSTSSAAVEGIFVGVLSTYFLMIAVGMSLFYFKEVAGAGKIYAGALASGVAVIVVIESAVDVLGPGPTIGALMGVAGSVGVILAAAAAKASRYGEDFVGYRIVGMLGVTVGAVVGAYLASSKQSGLSALFMCLCAATVPGTLILNRIKKVLKRHDRWPVINICLNLVTVVQFAVWGIFTISIPIQGFLTFVAWAIVGNAVCLLFILFSMFLSIFSKNKGQDEKDPSSTEPQTRSQITQVIEELSSSTVNGLKTLYDEAGTNVGRFTNRVRQRVRMSERN